MKYNVQRFLKIQLTIGTICNFIKSYIIYGTLDIWEKKLSYLCEQNKNTNTNA